MTVTQPTAPFAPVSDAPTSIARELPLMVPEQENEEFHGTAIVVSVDSSQQVTTGISATDRARTIRTLIDPVEQAPALERQGSN
jgi:3,4-dihydroxy-2-butanone 4-phosphate synthase